MTGSVKLVAAARFIHDGRRLFSGDRFEATEEEALELEAIHFAFRARNGDYAGPSGASEVLRLNEDVAAEAEPRAKHRKRKKGGNR